jgi:hypothetical protein
MVYLTASGTLQVFDASGVTNCSGGVRSPLWTANGASGPVTVFAGVAYVAGGHGVLALDATAVKDCSGTPKVCTPLWSYPLPEDAFPGGPSGQYFSVSGYPVISGTTLSVDTIAGAGVAEVQGGMEGFDANEGLLKVSIRHNGANKATEEREA